MAPYARDARRIPPFTVAFIFSSLLWQFGFDFYSWKLPGQLIAFHTKDPSLQLELFLVLSHTSLQDLITACPLIALTFIRCLEIGRRQDQISLELQIAPVRVGDHAIHYVGALMWGYGLMTPQFANSCRSDASPMPRVMVQIKGCGPLWTNAHLEAFVRNNFEYAYNLLSSHAFSGILGCFYSHGHTFQSVLSKYLP